MEDSDTHSASLSGAVLHSFFWECNEAARHCIDAAKAAICRERVQKCHEIFELFRESPTRSHMLYLLGAWTRAEIARRECVEAGPPSAPQGRIKGGTAPETLDAAAKAA